MSSTQDRAAAASLNRIEEEIRRFWQWYGIPEAVRSLRRGSVGYHLIQQPVAVAARRQVDQVRLLVVADLLARYGTMRGRAVSRSAGWSCHGLAVELEVEEALHGGAGAVDLERYCAECRRVAAAGVEQLASLCERLGVWLDPALGFCTHDRERIGVVWAVLHRLWELGRVEKRQVVTPACPRCGALFHGGDAVRRPAQVEAGAAWVRLPWEEEPDSYFLTWTDTPWMLIGLAALAVHPDAAYLVVERHDPPDLSPVRLVIAEAAAQHVPEGAGRIVRRVAGRALRGIRYRPLFSFAPSAPAGGRIVLSSEVPVERGSGVWPVTPAFDPLSSRIAEQQNLAVPELLGPWGILTASAAPWQGFIPIEVEPLLVEDLRDRGLVIREEAIRRSEWYCPHCDGRLLPLARPVWTVGAEGRRWIAARDGLWGAPLPIWRCDRCATQVCVAGLDDLAHRTGQEPGRIDPSRPAVDRVVFSCRECEGTMRRVPDVIEEPLETAAHALARAQEGGPADIAVGLDEEDGWLDLLEGLSGAPVGVAAPRQMLPLVPVAQGVGWDPERPFLGDAVRWALLCGATPEQAAREFLQPLWGAALALVPRQSSGEGARAQPGLPGRWLQARLAQAVRATTAALDGPDLAQATGELVALLEEVLELELASPAEQGGELLDTLSRLLAPFVPHLAEAMHRLVALRPGDSVHLARWPVEEAGRVDGGLLAQVALARELAALGEAARSRRGVEAARTLPRAIVGCVARQMPDPLPEAGVLERALRVKQADVVRGLPTPATWRLTLRAERTGGLGTEGAGIEAALAALDVAAASALVAQLWSGYSTGLEIEGRSITLLPQDVGIDLDVPDGWAVAGGTGWVVLLEIGSQDFLTHDAGSSTIRPARMA